MIVRIATEGQYEVDDARADELNALDNKCVEAVEAGDEATFLSTYAQLLEIVRTSGTELGDEELTESKVILPPPDLSFAEAGEQFTGDGLIPD